MGIRVGQYVLGANALVLPFAAAFFVLLSLQNLRKVTIEKPARAWVILLAASIGGIAGAWIHAYAFPAGRGDGMRFGLLGGHYGALLGVALGSILTRRPVLACLDAIVPALLAGSAVARIGCLFAGCCLGVEIPAFGPFQPFHYWPAFDLAALLLTAAVATRAGRRIGSANGIRLAAYLCLYGALRFLLEFARDLPPTVGPMMPAQAMTVLQVAAGILLLQWTRGTRTRERRCVP